MESDTEQNDQFDERIDQVQPEHEGRTPTIPDEDHQEPHELTSQAHQDDETSRTEQEDSAKSPGAIAEDVSNDVTNEMLLADVSAVVEQSEAKGDETTLIEAAGETEVTDTAKEEVDPLIEHAPESDERQDVSTSPNPERDAEAAAGVMASATEYKTAELEKNQSNDNSVPHEIPSATVKFVLLPNAQVTTMKCALNQTLKELKDHFAVELKIPANIILLLHDGENVENDQTLADLGVGPNGTVQLEMQSADPLNTPIKAFRPRQEYVMPDVITVRVKTDPGHYKDIVVEVERPTIKKPYLGGFRHKKTGVEYHNASAQTGQKIRNLSNVERFCRDTQTYNMRHRKQQTSEDTATQMTKIAVYVSNMKDRLLAPGKYTTAEQHHRMILRKVIIIQKYWRRWLSKRFVDRLKVDRQKRLEWEREEEIRKRSEKETRIKREFDRRMNPKTKEDFDLLYAALEKWRQEEFEKIDRTLTGAERKAALCQLLDQETQLIASIGRHKQDAGEDSHRLVVQSFLDKAAAPKKWKGPDGCYTEMDTPYTIRAQELRDIYNSVCMKYLTQDERLDVLLTLKHTVKEHDCKLTQEIIELIDREADLLMRGVHDKNLEGLRKRIATLFLQYIKTPTFNPEAARLLKVPQDPSQLRQNIYYCSSCNRYLSSVEFQLSTNSRTVGRCRKCRHLDNDARTRQDYSHYRLMLRDLRKLEESYGDDSKVAFLLQENDLRYLVEKIWNSQSIISAWGDVYDLVLIRWNKHREWSPWNCVLLTKEEATAHERLESLDEGYGKELVHKVHRIHVLAKNYFSRLPGMAEHMRKRVQEPSNGPVVEGVSVN